ncbi:MAG TPA: winged helix DNA-binding domain-containing protein [Chloroflexota bacterium]
MGARLTIDVAERRARLGCRHRLRAASRANSPEEVVESMIGLHATDPSSVFLSARARLRDGAVSAIEAALYDHRSLVRMLGMRRTMFVVRADMAPVVHAACTRAIAHGLRRRYVQFLGEAGVANRPSEWFASVEDATLAALDRLGEATAQELSREVAELRTRVHVAPHKSYTAEQNITNWVLTVLAAQGRIVRGRPRGSWVSSQYRWAPIHAVFAHGLPELAATEAQRILIEAWLRAFGPGTLNDIRWWTGLTMGEVRRAVASLDTVEVDLGEWTGVILADDVARVAPREPWAVLLPALDPTPMGYADRTWYLGPHGEQLFDRSGNIGPSVWWDGRIVGGWVQRRDGRIAWKLLEDLGHDAERRVEAEAHDLEEWLGEVRVTPRFRTPLERELSGTSTAD